MESQQSTTLDDSDEEDHVQTIISNIFEVQRFYQSNMEDLRHNLQMTKLKLEDLESLTLDLEILNQEKALTDEQLNSLKLQLDISQKQVFEKQSQIMSLESRDISAIDSLKSENSKLVNQIANLKSQHDFEK